jgi:diguanylate cyclase (GGDEF)-like protein
MVLKTCPPAALMTLDVSTLTFAAGVVAFASGLILLVNWWLDRTAWAAFWWGAASCGLGVGITMLALHELLPAFVSYVVAPLVLSMCAALMWVAARIFNRGSLKAIPVLATLGSWIAMLIVMGATGHNQLAAVLGAGISACLYTAAATEFWLARSEPLQGRWPMISLLSLEAIALFLAAFGLSSPTISSPVPSMSWTGIINFVGLIYSAGSAIFLIMMLKERSEAKHKAAALIDPLTGLANRRAFIDGAQRVTDRSVRDEVPISLLAFDLDRFKEINDTFGHPTGDHVLRIFADLLMRALRPADIAGRIGGEEFAVALPGCGVEAALAIARRVRSTFQDDARFVNGQRVGATLCVGVATAPEHGCSLADIMASADAALYRAKGLGRNRVMLAQSNSTGSVPAIVARIA